MYLFQKKEREKKGRERQGPSENYGKKFILFTLTHGAEMLMLTWC